MTQSSLTYGRGQRSRNRNKAVDYKRLAGEAGNSFFHDESVNSNLDDPAMTNGKNNNNYANKHVSRVIQCQLNSSNAQIVDDGKILTAENLKDPNHPLSMRKYILINDTPESIGMKVPRHRRHSNSERDEIFSIREIASIIGMSHPVTVIDVCSQQEMDGWTMGDLVEYFEDEDRIYLNASRHRCSSNTMSPSMTDVPNNHVQLNHQLVLNQISLEFSHTAFKRLVRSPKFVRDLDWIDTAWPKHRKEDNDFPTVQYYCLTSTAGCYTDFHIDFGGSSVWYHVISGEKIFLLLPPSPKNVKLYEQWLCCANQGDIFFLDMQDGENRPEQCNKVILKQGQTFIIPGGWIHAVYTPIDSIVLGGNFLHGLDIPCQLNTHCLETRIRVPTKFRFPYFVRMMFYAATFYLKKMQQSQQQPDDNMKLLVCKEEMDGLPKLIDALKVWSVQPKEDVGRIDSIAGTIQDCLSKFPNTNWTIDELLVAIEKELETYNHSSSLITNKTIKNIMKDESSSTIKEPLDLATSSYSNVHNKNSNNVLKIRLSTSSNISSGHSKHQIEQRNDENLLTNQSTSSPISALCNSENSENDFRISLCPSNILDFKPMPISSISKRNSRKIEDLTSRQRHGNENNDDDDEWRPTTTTTTKRKYSKQPKRKNNIHQKKEIPSLLPENNDSKSDRIICSQQKLMIKEKSMDPTNLKVKSFIRKQMNQSSIQRRTIKNTSARQRLAKKFKF